MSNCRSCQHAIGGFGCAVIDSEDFEAVKRVECWADSVDWVHVADAVYPATGAPLCPSYLSSNRVVPVTLDDLINEAHRTAVSKGWWGDAAADVLRLTDDPLGNAYEDRNLYEQVALMHSELSEAVEELRNGRGVTEVYYNEDKPGKPEGFPIELADVLIRIFDTAGRYSIDLPAAIDMKLKYNKSRPYRHGGKKA